MLGISSTTMFKPLKWRYIFVWMKMRILIRQPSSHTHHLHIYTLCSLHPYLSPSLHNMPVITISTTSYLSTIPSKACHHHIPLPPASQPYHQMPAITISPTSCFSALPSNACHHHISPPPAFQPYHQMPAITISTPPPAFQLYHQMPAITIFTTSYLSNIPSDAFHHHISTTTYFSALPSHACYHHMPLTSLSCLPAITTYLIYLSITHHCLSTIITYPLFCQL